MGEEVGLFSLSWSPQMTENDCCPFLLLSLGAHGASITAAPLSHHHPSPSLLAVPESENRLQDYPDRIKKNVGKCKQNGDKCKILHFGRKNQKHNYRLGILA